MSHPPYHYPPFINTPPVLTEEINTKEISTNSYFSYLLQKSAYPAVGYQIRQQDHRSILCLIWTQLWMIRLQDPSIGEGEGLAEADLGGGAKVENGER